MSSSQQRGKNYDNVIANELQEATGQDVHTTSVRGSGNTKHPQPDVLVRRKSHDVALELKRSSVATGEHYYMEGEDMVQLAKCRNDITHAYLGIKLTHRELCVVWLAQNWQDSEAVQALAEVIPNAFDPHVTDGGALRVSKPETSVWPSAQAGRDDVEVLADVLNLDLLE